MTYNLLTFILDIIAGKVIVKLCIPLSQFIIKYTEYYILLAFNSKPAKFVLYNVGIHDITFYRMKTHVRKRLLLGTNYDKK